METNRIAYIYKKDKVYRVFDHIEAQLHHNSLISDGYKHIDTIDTIIYLENKLNKNNK